MKEVTDHASWEIEQQNDRIESLIDIREEIACKEEELRELRERHDDIVHEIIKKI